jgi:hypothetical protein
MSYSDVIYKRLQGSEGMLYSLLQNDKVKQMLYVYANQFFYSICVKIVYCIWLHLII